MDRRTFDIVIRILAVALILAALSVLFMSENVVEVEYQREEAPESEEAQPEVKDRVFAFVTGYNTVEEQTDQTPCIAAAGYICGRSDVVACPSYLPLGSWVEIDGKAYECMDRTAEKFNGRFDISCDKNMDCPRTVTGWKEIIIYAFEKGQNVPAESETAKAQGASVQAG